jgi:hypothetical protein
MWLLSQYSSQHCGVYTYILMLNYLPLAHNLDSLRNQLLYKPSIGYQRNNYLFFIPILRDSHAIFQVVCHYPANAYQDLESIPRGRSLWRYSGFGEALHHVCIPESLIILSNSSNSHCKSELISSSERRYVDKRICGAVQALLKSTSFPPR